MKVIRNPKDFFTGLILLAVALVFSYGLRALPIGTSFRMGPGYFPLVLTGLLAVLALLIMANGFRGDGEPIGTISWRGLIIISSSILLFGATMKGLGFVPSVALTAFTSTFAERKWKPLTAILTALVLTAGSYLIFVEGLKLPLQAFGPWIVGR